MRDLVDRTPSERDSYEFTKINTVVNAFQIKSLYQMSKIAAAIGKQSDATQWKIQADRAKPSMNKLLFDPKQGCYIDGLNSKHASIHANLFPLAFGLVPEDRVQSVVDSLRKRDMVCSVYAAQYLLEALYQNKADDNALQLITQPNTKRSWAHMVNSGATIT